MGSLSWSVYLRTKSILVEEKPRNFVKKTPLKSTNSSWIWSVTPDNWKILKIKKVWGSRISKEKISQVVKSGDQVAFYVIGSNSFKGVYEFVGDWYDSPGVTWDDDLEPSGELRYKSQIEIKPVCLGNALLFDLHEKMILFKDKPTNIRNLILQGGSGYPSNNQKPLLQEDFAIILDELKNNSETTYDVVESQLKTKENVQQLIKNEIASEKYKICPRCKIAKIPLWDSRTLCRNCVRQPKLQNEYDSLVKNEYDSLVKNESESPSNNSLIIKECPQCHLKVSDSTASELEKLIEEKFGYRQMISGDSSSKVPQSYCRKCRSQNMETKLKQTDTKEVESQNSKYVKIFDSNGDAIIIKHCTIESTDVIQKGQNLTNDEIVAKFGVGNMGGIRYTKNNDVIVLLSTYSDDYDDSIDIDSGLIIYTGEGKGNQELKNGNEKILNSKNTPMVFFKEVYQEPGVRKRGALDNKYNFVGTVKYQNHYWKTEKERRVVKFVLEVQS